MKYLVIIFLLLIITLTACTQIKEPTKYDFSRMEESKISFQYIKDRLPCYPNLISHWNNEKGFADKMEVTYGEIELVRTDIGEPDGYLYVSLHGKKICEIELSLMPDIYYQSKNKLLLIYGYSGSNHFIELFRLEDGCDYIGWADISSQTILDEIQTYWYHQADGSKTCQK